MSKRQCYHAAIRVGDRNNPGHNKWICEHCKRDWDELIKEHKEA